MRLTNSKATSRPKIRDIQLSQRFISIVPFAWTQKQNTNEHEQQRVEVSLSLLS